MPLFTIEASANG